LRLGIALAYKRQAPEHRAVPWQAELRTWRAPLTRIGAVPVASTKTLSII
jgi:hypothetical protein